MGYKDPGQQRAYQLEWIRRRRTEWITQNGPCALCGSTENLEVDHVDPAAKTMDPARIWSLSAAKRAAELAKCQVLCNDCHLEKTLREKTKPPPQPHGTKARYSRRHGGCRCPLCRAAAKQYDRERRARPPVVSPPPAGGHPVRMEDTENAAQTCERVTVTLTPKASAALTALCGPGQNKTDAVNRALVMYAFLEEQIAGGATVLIRHPDGAVSEVRFL